MSAALKLEVFQNGQLLQEIPLQGELWVGRDEACPIHLNDRAISRKHGVIRANDRGAIEFESRSKFGWVKVNGQEQTQAVLKDGDRVEMGPYELRIKSLRALAEELKSNAVQPVQLSSEQNQEIILSESKDSADAHADTPSDMTKQLEPGHDLEGNYLSGIEPGLPPDVVPLEVNRGNEDFGEAQADGATRLFQGQETAKAVLFFGPQNANVEHFELGDQEISIGRSQQCNVVLADKRSSRRHAVIRKQDKQYILKDLGSANGTLVNEVRVENEVELQSGDRIQIGDSAFTFQMVQADYQQKKEQFIPVPPQELQQVESPMAAASMMEQPMNFMPSSSDAAMPPPPSFDSATEPTKKKTILGPLIQRYRMMSTRQQIIWGLLVFGSLYVLLEEEPEAPKQTQTVKKDKKQTAQKVDKVTFETLTPEQQRYVDSQYQLGFDHYKNREYDKAMFEIEKIFSLVHDYKQSREIYSYATEGKRKLEALEEERKRKEKETQDKVKLLAFLDQAGSLMERRKYREAEELFPEIELLEPENSAVSAWRKVIASENDRLEQDRQHRQVQAELKKTAMKDLAKAKSLIGAKSYYPAIELMEDILDRKLEDQKFNHMVETEISNVYSVIAQQRDPLLKQGKEQEDAGKYAEAYRAYEEALKVDSDSEEATKGMDRIRGTLQAQAKSIYTEGVFAESFNDFETAEKKYREVMDVVPKDDDYYIKATSRLNKITVFKRPKTRDLSSSSSEEGIPQ